MSLLKVQLATDWTRTYNQWIADDLNDPRKMEQVIVDFTIDRIERNQTKLVDALMKTNHLLLSLIPDPKIPEDLKGMIREYISTNKSVLKLNEDVPNEKPQQ